MAGGASHRFLINQPAAPPQDFSNIDIVTMSLSTPTTPSSSPAGLAAGAVLMLLAVGFAARRRF